MKRVKILISILFISASLLLTSCSECNNENPIARVSNLGTENVSVQIKTTGGNTENINNIEPGKSSEFTSYASGDIQFTIVLKDKTEVIENVTMSFCKEYEIIVNQDNTITTTSSENE